MSRIRHASTPAPIQLFFRKYAEDCAVYMPAQALSLDSNLLRGAWKGVALTILQSSLHIFHSNDDE